MEREIPIVTGKVSFRIYRSYDVMFDSYSKRQEILDDLPFTTRYFTDRLEQRPLYIFSRIKEDMRFHFDEILEKYLVSRQL